MRSTRFSARSDKHRLHAPTVVSVFFLRPCQKILYHLLIGQVLHQVSEGLEVLDAINEAICDDKGRPLQNIRIRHTILLDDPFPDPPQLADHIPEGSPEPVHATVCNN